MRRKLVLTFSLLFAVLCSWADEVEFNVNARRIVELDEPFRVEFTVNASAEDFQAPSFDGFSILAGPSTSQGTSVQFINGKMSKSVNFTYTYVLRAEKVGNFEIGSATCSVDDKSYKTSPYPIEVASSSSQNNNSGYDNGSGYQEEENNPQRTSQSQSVAKDDILLRTEVSSRSVYKGEPIVVKLNLYYRANISNIGNFKAADFNGFWKYDFQPASQNPRRVTYNDKVYDMIPISQFLIFPQKSGEVTIGNMQLTAAVAVMAAGGGGQSMFDSFFGGMNSYTTVEKRITSPEVTINVKNLPAGAPASFKGAVGKFNFKAALSNNEIMANNSANLTLTLSGSGNMPLITAPNVELPGSFENYPVKSNDNFKESFTNIEGVRTFEYPFIARAEGDFNIKPIEFTYFDLATNKYVTISSGDLLLKVTKDSNSTGNSSGTIIGGVTKEELRILGKDINFIKTSDSSFSNKGDFFIGSWKYFALLFLIVAIFVSMLIYMKKRIKELRDTVKIKNKKANKVALARLKSGRKAMADGRENDFYTEILQALSGYAADKLNIEAAHLSKDNIRTKMSEKGILDDDIEQFLNTISECEMARYAPATAGNMDSVYNATLELIGRMESKL